MTIPKKVAICITGEYRTFSYCLPWLQRSIEEKYFDEPVEIDFFLYVKLGNTNRYKRDLPPKTVADDQAIEHLMSLKPKRHRIVPHADEHERQLAKLDYRGLLVLESMARVINLKTMYELETGTTYDLCWVRRTDTIFGEGIDELAKTIKLATNKDTVYLPVMGLRTPTTFYEDCLQDTSFFSDSLTATRLGRAFADVCNTSDLVKLSDYNDNPHAVIKTMINELSLGVEIIHGLDAIVREESGLPPVFDSFPHHIDYITNQNDKMKLVRVARL